MADETRRPFIIFKLQDELYCIDSTYVESLLQLPEFDLLPLPHPHITGMFKYRNHVIEMFDMRSAFGFPTLNQEFENFKVMIDTRKQDHIRWVDELERASEAKEPFKLATDPHKCAFGKWYDNFKHPNQSLSFHLKKIKEPHEKLHHAALDVAKCAGDCDKCPFQQCVRKVLKQIRNDTMPLILDLLEETKEIFRSIIYHEMVIALRDKNLGIIVDEIISVEELSDIGDTSKMNTLHASGFVSHIRQSKVQKGIILEIDVPSLTNSLDD